MQGRRQSNGQPGPPVDDEALSHDDFQRAFGEPVEAVLNLDHWEPGFGIHQSIQRLEAIVSEAVNRERVLHHAVRSEVFQALRSHEADGIERDVFRASRDQLETVYRSLLFAGGVEACQGVNAVYDTMSLTAVQIGVCLISYQGDKGSWAHRIFRRDMRIDADSLENVLDVLERRRLGALEGESPRDRLSELARRSIMAYAERAALVHKSSAPWRMGHGLPIPYELLTGAGLVKRLPDGSSVYPIMRAAVKMVRDLVLKHRRFIFVPSRTSDNVSLTIGGGLRPLEYAILGTAKESLARMYEQRRGHYPTAEARVVQEFVEEVGPQIVRGVYKVSHMARPHNFYAHRAHAHEAALIVMADSLIQEHRGFPALLELADKLCQSAFGVGTFLPAIQVAYAEAGEPYGFWVRD